jgi:hypothetical protein
MNDKIFYICVYAFTFGAVLVILPSTCRFIIQTYFKERKKHD